MITHLRYTWGLLATHIPGRSGYECQRRWNELLGVENAPEPEPEPEPEPLVSAIQKGFTLNP